MSWGELTARRRNWFADLDDKRDMIDVQRRQQWGRSRQIWCNADGSQAIRGAFSREPLGRPRRTERVGCGGQHGGGQRQLRDRRSGPTGVIRAGLGGTVRGVDTGFGPV